MLAVGNVGEQLASYTESDIFLTRDGGFTWEEIHKDAHMWEFGDSGSVIVIVNDEEATDHVLFSTDEGWTWTEHNFGEMLRVQSIQTVPQDTSRRFMLIGVRPGERGQSVLVHLDFSAITQQKCESGPHSGKGAQLMVQVSLIRKIPTMTTLSCGLRRLRARRSACSAARRSTTGGSETGIVTLGTRSSSLTLSRRTVHAQ
jgi:hypothetical protein